MSFSSKGRGGSRMMATLVMPIALSSTPLLAQDQQGYPPPPQRPPQQAQPQQEQLSERQIQQLVAPIALYPDALLAQVLTASTYPLEVAMAARWAEKNPNMKGQALQDAMQHQAWDPSVKGLTSVPQVLAMMNDKLDWTNQLGEAFLAQPDDVQNAIQALRQRAEAAGNLKSSKEQTVRRVAPPPDRDYAGPDEYIAIDSPEPDYVYVPVYDPVVIYGPGYWEPAYTPFYWYPPWWTVGVAFGFGAPLFVGPALWYHYDWGHRGYAVIQTNRVLYSRYNKVNLAGHGPYQAWKFNPAHHGNVPFRNAKLQQQFVSPKRVQGAMGRIHGVQSGKSIQGIHSGGKNIQGVQTGKNVQGDQMHKAFQQNQTRHRDQETNRHFQMSQKNNQTSHVNKHFQMKNAGQRPQGHEKGQDKRKH